MILLLNKFFLFLWKYFFFPIIFLIIILELFFQIIFNFDIKNLKKTILFFNPYCDQSYWNLEGNSSYNKDVYTYHPTLSLIKSKNKNLFNKSFVQDKKLIFYGSSFIDHEFFTPLYEDSYNFAVKSYGLDQIYKSYMITKDQFENSNIVIGFLLEDIDRSIFYQRNLPKLKYFKNKNNYELSNIPIVFKENLNTHNHFYIYNFIKNLRFLILNEFNYKKSKCKINEKKEIFKYFINNIISASKDLNQNIFFITFNFKDDILNPNWRYHFVKNYLNSKKVEYIDMSKMIKDDKKINDFSLSNYYNNRDFHLSEYGFNLLKKKIDIVIKQYM